ncbi:hypothetical protein BEL04_02230 [Mucilaginibacter sp. PPCGB 2223]|uniref:DUF2625 family protein n=1 Tax=Mucilaginibacter sp. PPCGB 2223 TaxID=1886027 RepID=UPI0008260650|nr:DUF2625 family protein [Mucilaginibacter sp. PPCGB 2223]OCX53155.1 hypothetical protein BEL04_02230 [Mucilaginibacter sp. PPCGB 2223]
MSEKNINETWDQIQSWVNTAKSSQRQIEILHTHPHSATEVFQKTGINESSYLGIVITHTGGILVDSGWLRILGSGSEKLPRSIESWNFPGTGKQQRMPQAILFADDVLGGFFAINNGAFNTPLGEVYYFAPDTLEWEGLDVSFDNFLKWVCTDQFEEFYSAFRFDNWQTEIKSVSAEQFLSIYPPLWSDDVPIGERSKKAISIEEAWQQTKGDK